MKRWPIGSLSFAQTFFGDDPEIISTRAMGSCGTVGIIELFRRLG